MHFIVAWNIPQTSMSRVQVEERLNAVLKPYSWVRPLPDFFIVNVTDHLKYKLLADEIVQVAQQFPKEVNVVISPPISGGGYLGWLPANLWPEINSRAT